MGLIPTPEMNMTKTKTSEDRFQDWWKSRGVEFLGKQWCMDMCAKEAFDLQEQHYKQLHEVAEAMEEALQTCHSSDYDHQEHFDEEAVKQALSRWKLLQNGQ